MEFSLCNALKKVQNSGFCVLSLLWFRVKMSKKMGETDFIYLIYGRIPRSSRSVEVLFALCSTWCWVEEETSFLSLGIFRFSYNVLPVLRQPFQNSNIAIWLILKKKKGGSVKNTHFYSHVSFLDPFNKD